MAKSEASRRWDALNLKSFTIRFPIAEAVEVEAAAINSGVSRTRWLKQAIKEKLERDRQ
jgi:hypothetical protein